VDVFERAYRIASSYRQEVGNRPVGARASREELLQALSGPLPEKGDDDPASALESFARAVDPGLVASAGPRYFGFVTGSGLPQAVAADWLVSAWNQNASFQIASPAAAAVEEVAIGWLVELLGLPPGVSCGFVTGGQTANFTCLLAARNEVLRRAGWDVEARGLSGAPRVRIVFRMTAASPSRRIRKPTGGQPPRAPRISASESRGTPSSGSPRPRGAAARSRFMSRSGHSVAGASPTWLSAPARSPAGWGAPSPRSQVLRS